MKILSLPEPYRQLCIDAYKAIWTSRINTNTSVAEINWVKASHKLGINTSILFLVHRGEFDSAYSYLPERYIIPPTIKECFTALTELKELIENYDQKRNA